MTSRKKLSLLITSLIAFIDVMGIGLVYPMFSSMLFQGDCLLLPPESSDAFRGTCLGILLAMMPITQFFSAPILGLLSDQKGRKKILIPSLAIGVIGYLIAVLAVNLESFSLLLLSRVAVGISAGTAAVVQAAIADISTPEEKTKNFGILNMACGLGFTAGPFIGGILSGVSLGFLSGYSLPFALAGFVVLLNLIMVVFLFQDTYLPKSGGKIGLGLGMLNIRKAIQIPGLKLLFFSVFLACVGWSFYWEFIPVTWISTYHFDTSTVGNFYAYGAAFYALSCGVLIRPIVNRFPDKYVLCAALLICSTSIALLMFHSNPVWLWFYIPLQQFGIALFWPTAATVVSNSVSEDVQGEIMGVLQSVDSLAFAISPLIAGPLLGITITMPIIIGSTAMFAAVVVLGARLRKPAMIME
ncbi:MAG: MFS transporter [Parachlamydiaceae bacterium]|nr:MFS transporter [Parachlamydiaceae bacterium]